MPQRVHNIRAQFATQDEALQDEEAKWGGLGEAIWPSAEDEAEETIRREVLAGDVSALPERLRILLTLRYENGYTLEECAGVLGVSKSYAWQMNNRALRHLRRAATGRGG